MTANWLRQLNKAFSPPDKPFIGQQRECPGCYHRPSSDCAACGRPTAYLLATESDGKRHALTLCRSCALVAYDWYAENWANARRRFLTLMSARIVQLDRLAQIQAATPVVHLLSPTTTTTEKLATTAPSSGKIKSTSSEPSDIVASVDAKPVAHPSSRKELAPVASGSCGGKGTIARSVRARGTAQKKRPPSPLTTERRAS